MLCKMVALYDHQSVLHLLHFAFPTLVTKSHSANLEQPSDMQVEAPYEGLQTPVSSMSSWTCKNVECCIPTQGMNEH